MERGSHKLVAPNVKQIERCFEDAEFSEWKTFEQTVFAEFSEWKTFQQTVFAEFLEWKTSQRTMFANFLEWMTPKTCRLYFYI